MASVTYDSVYKEIGELNRFNTVNGMMASVTGSLLSLPQENSLVSIP